MLENYFAELIAVSKGRLQEDSVMIERDKLLCIPMNDTDYFYLIFPKWQELELYKFQDINIAAEMSGCDFNQSNIHLDSRSLS